MTKVAATLAGQSRLDRIAYQTVRGIVVGFCRTWCRMSIEGERGWVQSAALWGVAPDEIIE